MTNQIVIKLPENTLNEFTRELVSAGAFQIDTKGKYEFSRFKINNGSIIIYKTGKIVADNEEPVKKLLSNTIKKLPISFAYPKGLNPNDFEVVIGSDETGKGEWLGPLVITAVAIKPDMVYDLIDCGVMDSKIVPKNNISEVCECIRSNILSRNIVTISPKRFNELSSRSGIENLNHILDWAHGRAIMNLYMELYRMKFNGKILTIVDDFAPHTTTRNLDKIAKRNDTVLHREKNAERYIVVAAASILSKCVRNNWINTQLNKYGISPDISPEEAINHPKVNEFAKVQYLKTLLKRM